MRAPIPNMPRLAGYSYPIGNQLYLQTAETLLWYAEYLDVSQERYGFSPVANMIPQLLCHWIQRLLGAKAPRIGGLETSRACTGCSMLHSPMN